MKTVVGIGILIALSFQNICQGSSSDDSSYDGEDDQMDSVWKPGYTGHYYRYRRSLDGFCDMSNGISVALVIDTTGSMSNEIAEVKKYAITILNELTNLKDHRICDLVFVPAHDEIPMHEQYTKTRNLSVITEAIEDISASGGGNCPEKTMVAIEKAIDLSYDGSFILVFTDADPDDPELLDVVKKKMQQKMITMFIVLTDVCHAAPHKAFVELTKTSTMGHLAYLSKYQIPIVVEIMQGVKPMFLKKTDVIISTQGEATAGTNSTIDVGPYTPRIDVTASGTGIGIVLKDPSGSTPKNIKRLTDSSNFKMFSVEDPAPGEWTVTVKSDGDYKVVASGSSDIDIDFGFSTGLTNDILSVAKSPARDMESYILLRVSDPNKVFNISVVDILMDDSTKKSLPVDVVDEDKGLYRARKLVYPEGSFKVKITAFANDGHKFTRESFTSIESKEPGPPVIDCRDKMLASAGVPFNITCTVESQTVVEVTTYKVGSTHTHTERFQKTSRVSISFLLLLKKDSGSYIFEATNKQGSASKIIQLAVIENPPKASILGENPYTITGASTTIKCRCDSFTDCHLEWSKSNSPSDDFSEKTAVPLQSEGNVVVEKVEVILTPAQSKDAGWYICTARNGGGTSVAKTYLKVYERPEVEIQDSSKTPTSLITFKQSSTVTITCVAKKGVPPPRLTWFRHNRPIVDTKIGTIHGDAYITHTISNAQQYNEGNYSCSGYNDVDVDEKNVTLQFISAPKISRPSSYSRRFLIGADAVLSCYFDGTPMPVVTWTRKIGDSITAIEDRKGTNTSQNLGKALLTISKLSVEDTGTYYCEASNIAGSQKTQMSLRVEKKPTLEVTSDEVSVPLYGTIELPCNPDGIPVPTVTWRKIGGKLSGKSIGTNYRITNAALEEEGVYVCRAENIHGDAELRVNVTISGTAPPKLFKEPKSNIHKGFPGGNITLNCPIIQGEPVPTLTWYHRGKTVENGRPFIISQEYRSLTINPVTEDVNGNYTCVAQNGLGEDKRTFTLALYEKPRIIEPAGQIFIEDKESAVLTCSTEGDPVPTVTWSSLFRKNETLIPQVSSFGFTKLVIPKGTVKKRNKYLCRARNRVGVAEKVFEVVVKRPPKIKVHWEKEITLKGDVVTFKLNCTSSGNPKPTYHWTHNGNAVYAASPTNPILPVKYEKGNYGCTARNKFGEDSRATIINRLGPPEIKKLPAVTPAPNGGKIVLNCTVSGFPAPTISWSFNGNKMVGRQSSEYEIRRMSKSAEGIYTCVASNSEGSTQQTTRLIMLDVPIINCEQQYYEVKSGQMVNFLCRVGANPRATIKWYKDGRLWDSGSKDGSLQFVAAAEDTGLFKVEALNEFGIASKEIELTVLRPPTFSSSHVREINVTAGSEVLLPCQAVGFPQPKSNWDIITMPAPRNKVKIMVETGSLRITDVQIDDEGDYKCTAENKAGSQIHFVHLNVVEKPRVSIITKNLLTNGDVNSGDDVILTCIVKGKPIPELNWFKDDQLLSTNKMIRFKASQSKSGNYTCKAKNGIGEASDSVAVNAISPPSISGLPYETVSSVEGLELELSCSATGNPPPSIVWLQNDRKLESAPGTKIDGSSLRIFKLSKEFFGNITCEASNSRGTTQKTFGIHVNTSPKIIHAAQKEIPVYFHNEFAVPCKAEGLPKPFIEWTTDIGGKSMIMSSGDSIDGIRVLSDGTLIGRNVTWKEVRSVTCAATNVAGSDTSKHILQVTELPRSSDTVRKLLDRSPSAVLVETKRRQRKILDCPPKPLTSPRWLKDFKIIQRNDYESGRYTLLDGNRRLSVNSPDVADLDTFTCGDSTGPNYDFILNVVYEPYFRFPPVTEYDVLEGSRLDISCEAEGNPTPMIFWFVSDLAFEWIPINNYTVENVEITGSHNERFRIKSTFMAHSGQYKCVARNGIGEIFRQFAVTVAAETRVKGARLVKKSVSLGDPFQLICEVVGEPDIVYEWFLIKDGREQRLSIGSKELNFTSSTFADSSSFECRGTSSTGSARQEFKVDVVVAPRLKGEPKQTIPFFSGDRVELECIAEEDSVYIVNWTKGGKKLTSTERVVFIPIRSSGDIMTITNANKLDAGEYECTVYNEAGGEDRKTFFLRFIDVIPNSKTVVNFTLGGALKLPCPLTSEDTSREIIWKKDGSIMARPFLRKSDFYKVETRKGDEGIYECIFARKPDIRLIFEVNMMISPKMLQTRTKRALDLKIGDDLAIECAAEGIPTPKFYWTKNDEEILEGGDSFYVSTSDGSSRLWKNNISNGDGGRYICHAWSQSGEAYAPYDVIVVDNSIDNPNDGVTKISVQNNRPLSIICPFFDSTPDRIQWEKGGYAWSKSNMEALGFTLSYNDGYSSVRTSFAYPNHGDIYICSFSGKTHTFIVNITIPMHFNDWSEWSECSASCGGGTKKRERMCEASIEYQPEDIVTLINSSCVGQNVQNQPCNPSPCPVDGGWSGWKEGSCSQSCGGGVRRSRRLCDNPPPSSGGKTCEGPSEKESRCAEEPCPVDGGWSDWTSWSSCSSTCDYGVKHRYRSCDRPKPAHGGRPCQGSSIDERVCNLTPCTAKEIERPLRTKDAKWIWSEWEVVDSCPPGCNQTMKLESHGQCVGHDCRKSKKIRTKSEPCPQPPECK